MASRKPAYRRSRLRLLLLIALALIVLFGIGAWNAPDDVRSRASELAHHVSDAASDRWNSAKEWSGWQSAADLTSSEPYSLYVLPDPPLSPQGGKEERFLSYLPHSGYHNQRSELANALSLAKMLDRTLLVPPVWIGWPSTTKPYRDLQATWDRMMEQHEHAFEDHRGDEPTQLTPQQPQDSSSNSLTAEDCKSYAKECRGTYQDTFVAWRFLTNLEVAAQRVPIVDRFNMTEAYARELSGAESDDDIVRCLLIRAPQTHKLTRPTHSISLRTWTSTGSTFMTETVPTSKNFRSLKTPAPSTTTPSLCPNWAKNRPARSSC